MMSLMIEVLQCKLLVILLSPTPLQKYNEASLEFKRRSGIDLFKTLPDWSTLRSFSFITMHIHGLS